MGWHEPGGKEESGSFLKQRTKKLLLVGVSPTPASPSLSSRGVGDWNNQADNVWAALPASTIKPNQTLLKLASISESENQMVGSTRTRPDAVEAKESTIMLSELSIYIVAFGGAAVLTGFTCLLACAQDDDDSQRDE